MTYEDSTGDYDACVPVTPWIPEIERIKRMQADIDALKCERAALREEMIELLETLEPFAKRASHIDSDTNDGVSHWHPAVGYPVYVRDLRRAYRVFNRRYRS